MRSRSGKRLLRHSQNDTVKKPSPPFLPEELIVEILVRLPVRLLLQYKCVCKTWKTLISDPQFAKSHVLSSNASLRLVSIVCGLGRIPIISYPLKLPLEDTSKPQSITLVARHWSRLRHILGSCNGLICLYDHRLSKFRLWNPSINLKSSSSPTILCFHRKRILYCGFGYDRVNDTYKLLVVVQNKSNSKETKTILYTFGENSWTSVQNFPCGPPCDTYSGFGKFVSGSLNWIVNKDVIISFDLGKETYGEMLLPQHHYDPVLYVLSNCICVSFYHSKEKSWVMWMMKEYGVVESWTKLMIFPQDGRPLSKDALFISENGVLLLRNKNNSELIVYNLNDNGDYCCRIFGAFGRDLHVYHESLVSPQW